MAEKKKNKELKILFTIILALILIIVLVIGTGMFYIKGKLDKMQQVDLSEVDLGITETVAKNLTKYRNIAIFGVDSRSDDYGIGNRSDCIIIASINNETGAIKLISVYRDTYVNIEGHGLDKITHAYSFGEAPLAIKTLNQNFDLNIQEFVTVNFDSVAEAVDELNGVQVKITEDEIKYINDYINATSKITGKKSTGLGLYLCKKLCDKLGLNIELDSEKDINTHHKSRDANIRRSTSSSLF